MANLCSGFFNYYRGVRQGDPFSPLLFGIDEDSLSRYMIRLCKLNIFSSSSSTRCKFFPFYLFYADNVLFLRKATKKNLLTIKELLEIYLGIFCQTVSIKKSKVYLNSTLSNNTSNRLLQDWNILITSHSTT